MANQPDYSGLQSMEGTDTPKYSITPADTYRSQPQSQTPIQTPNHTPSGYPHDHKQVATTSSNSYYAPSPYGDKQESSEPRKPRQNPCGLSPLIFAAIVALITALIVGGAVGGGVAAAKSSKATCSATPSSSNNNSSNSSTGTGTSTASTSGSTTAPTGTFRSFIPPSPSQVESLYNDCGSLNGSTVTSAQGTNFKVTCPQAILGSSGSNGVTLSEVVAYTFQDCVNACSLMNFWKGSTVCNSVTWDNGMAGATAANFGGNCWLFKDSTTFQVKANSTSARLQSS